MHNCKPCEHKEVRYCSDCGLVFCDECGKEWYAEQSPNYYPYYPWESYRINYNTTDDTCPTYSEGGSWTDN